jgi:hypothetical protein
MRTARRAGFKHADTPTTIRTITTVTYVQGSATETPHIHLLDELRLSGIGGTGRKLTAHKESLVKSVADKNARPQQLLAEKRKK